MAVDALRKRFGIDSINESPNRDKENLIDHMSGGISHEKRTVDYEKPSREYKCKAFIGGLEQIFKLVYFTEEYKWVMII